MCFLFLRLRSKFNNYSILKEPSRPASAVSLIQPKRVPFANYGWATKTKDLSIKPTHNALANKVRLSFVINDQKKES